MNLMVAATDGPKVSQTEHTSFCRKDRSTEYRKCKQMRIWLTTRTWVEMEVRELLG